MRRLSALAIGCALIALLPLPKPSLAAPYTVDRLLALEQLAFARLDAGKRWLVVQRYARWDRAPAYDLDYNIKLGLGRVQVFDMAADGRERRLALPPGPGYVAFGVSPDGRRLAVARMAGHAYELGVVELSTGQARWLGVSPRQAVWGPSVLWASNDTLLVAARPADFPDAIVGLGYLGHQRLVQQWAATAQGRLGASVLSSGRYRGLRLKAPVVGLVSIDLKTGAQRILAPGQVRDLSLSPDGRAAAALIEGEDIQYDLPEPATSATEPTRMRMVLVDLASGRATTPCPDCDPMARFQVWSDDGRELLIYARQGPVSFAQGRYWRLSAAGTATPLDLDGLTPVLGETPDTAGLPLGGWLDGAPVVHARPTHGARADYWRIDGAHRTNLTANLPPGGRAIGADPQAWAVAAEGRIWRVSPRAARPWGVARGAVRSLADGPAGFRGDQNFVPRLGDLALEDPAARPVLPWPGPRLPAPAAGISVVGVTPRGRIEVAQDARGVQTVSLARPKAAPKVLTTLNPDLAGVAFSAPIAVHHPGLDGKALTSWLYLPPGLAPGSPPPPVVVLPYPGAAPTAPPRAQAPGTLSLSVNAQVLAARGYAAIVPAMPYLRDREPIEGLADQILAPVDAAAAQGLVDPDRVAVWGHSYGGYGALAAATQSPRFKAVIATAPTVNLASAYGRLGPVLYAIPEYGPMVFASTGWQESGQVRMGAPPWKAPQLYLRNSPITFVDRITAPVLVFHGDNDKGVDQSAALFGALYRQNKDAIFVTYRGEGHVFYSPANVRDYFQRVLALLDDTVGPGSARLDGDGSKLGQPR